MTVPATMGLKALPHEGLPTADTRGLFPAIGTHSREPPGGDSGGGGGGGGDAVSGTGGLPSPHDLPNIAGSGGMTHSPGSAIPGPDPYGRTSQLTSTSSSRSSNHPTLPPSPTKLPNISKIGGGTKTWAPPAASNSMRRTISLPTEALRANLCRSPSCPTLWTRGVKGDVDDDVDTDVFALHRSLDCSTKSDSPTKLPSIFNGSTIPTRSLGRIPRSVSLHRKLGHFGEAPLNIGGAERTSRVPKREGSTMPLTHASDAKEKQEALTKRRSQNPMLLPIRDEPMVVKRTGSKKNMAAAHQASEGTSGGDSGVSVGCRPSLLSDSSAALDGSDTMGIWGPEVEVEVEMDDETLHHGHQVASPSKGTSLQDAGDRKSTDHRTTLSAEKCREWLKGVSDDGKTKHRADRDKLAFQMPNIN